MSARALTRMYDEVLAPSGVRITQLSMLAAVAFHGPFTVKALAGVLVMDRTTLTADLKPLESQGLIQIVPGQDRRTRVVSITKQGLEAIERAAPLWRQAQERVVQRLGDHRVSFMLGELKEVIALGQTT